MRWWDNVRTALTLANRVEECEQLQQEMQNSFNELLSEWTDVQDKLLAREERLRKRLSRELKQSLESPPAPEQPSAPISSQAASPSPAHLAIRRQWEQQRRANQ